MLNKNSYKNLGFVLSALLLVQTSAYADMQEIEGVPFYIEKIEKYTDGTVKLSYDGTEKIVAQDQLDEAILDLYFAQGSNFHLAVSQLKKFITNAINSGTLERAKRGIKVYFETKRFRDEEISSFFEVLPEKEETVSFLQYAYSLLKDREEKRSLLDNIFLLIGLKDANWLAEHTKDLTEMDITILNRITNTYFGATFFENDITLRNKILVFEKNVFGVSSAIYKKHLEINKTVVSALEQLQSYRFSSIYKLVNFIKYDNELYLVLMPFVRECLHGCISHAIESDNLQKAFEAMSLINKDWRTDKTYELIITLLNKALASDQIITVSPAFNDLISAVAMQDQMVKQDYFLFIDRQVDLLLEKGFFDSVEQLFRYVTVLRADPNQDNDEIRAKEVLFLMSNNQVVRAKEKLATIQTSLPFGMRIQLVLSGIYFSIWKFLACLVLFIIAFVFIKKARTPKESAFDQFKNPFAKKSNKEIKEDVEDDQPLFVANGSELCVRNNPKFRLYKKYLCELGLPDNVSSKTIKLAYRKMIKDYHPDYHADQSPEDHDKFIHLTEVFKSVMQLRQQLGFPED